jgi:hypothetical protein
MYMKFEMEDDRRVVLTRQAKFDHSVGGGRYPKNGGYTWVRSLFIQHC